MKTRIGYLIPEFPGQTHIFIWRERHVLAQMGIETALVSTRPPPASIASHSWAGAAREDTAYLAPFSGKDLLRAAGELLRAGPIAWIKCLATAATARGLTFKQRVRLFGLIAPACKLVRFAREQGWDHIHVHSCADAANVALMASLLAPLTYSLTLHGPRLETYGPNQPQKWAHAQFGLVVSDKLLTHLKRELDGFLPPWLRTAPMGVDLDRIRRETPYRPWRGEGPCRIFASGRLNPVKGHEHLIEAVRQLRGRGLDVRLEIAGEDEQGGGGFRQVLEARIAELGLNEHVKLLGAVSEERVRQGLERAHVFALASLDEGVPVAVMEAMAMEAPVVVTDVGGARELMDDGVDALLVQPEDAAALAEQVETVLREPELATRLGRAARQKISARFQHRRSAEALAEGLRERAGQKGD